MPKKISRYFALVRKQCKIAQFWLNLTFSMTFKRSRSIFFVKIDSLIEFRRSKTLRNEPSILFFEKTQNFKKILSKILKEKKFRGFKNKNMEKSNWQKFNIIDTKLLSAAFSYICIFMESDFFPFFSRIFGIFYI